MAMEMKDDIESRFNTYVITEDKRGTREELRLELELIHPDQIINMINDDSSLLDLMTISSSEVLNYGSVWKSWYITGSSKNSALLTRAPPLKEYGV